MGTQCSFCFPLAKGHSPFEIDVLDESSEKDKEETTQNVIDHSQISEKKTPLNTMQINEKPQEASIFIAYEGENENLAQRPRCGKEDFQILKLLGKGSFGRVMLVEKKDTNKVYAMKIISKNMVEKRNQKLHTKAERAILENIDSPFIVQLHYAFQTCDKLYLVMDFMIGGELFYHLRRCQRFSEAKTRFYAAEIVLAIEHLHRRNIIYRDLKPENILLGADGHLKIADFGLSKQGVHSNEKTYTFCGTIDYIAPEILLGLGHDKSVDWWSLGILIYEMLCGEPPFYNKDKTIMFKNILESDVRLGSSAEDAKEIKSHPFFKCIEWDHLLMKKLEPPYKPLLNGRKDLSHFSKLFTEENARDTPITRNRDSHSQEYSNFTYIKRDTSSIGSAKNEDCSEMLENPYFNLLKPCKEA